VAAIDACGFDPEQWNHEDVHGTLRALPMWLEWLVEGADPSLFDELRPYAVTVLRAREIAPDAGDERDNLHHAWHALDLAGRIRHRDTTPQQGLVFQVNSSHGGVPKLPVGGTARIDWNGLVTDRQDDRHNHGRPWQAICLWSKEVIDSLADEGHPIGPGSCGENITVTGLDWSKVSPGLRMRVGTSLLETTPYAIPCAKNAQWFTGGDFRRMTHDLYPGVSRIYARVIEPGAVAPGDVVAVLP
jgi:MOSC domain-containing protein YiiM